MECAPSPIGGQDRRSCRPSRSVNEITESDMSHLGVKRGHRRVIQRAIASRRGAAPTCVPAGPF